MKTTLAAAIAALALTGCSAALHPGARAALPVCNSSARSVPCVAPRASVPEALAGGWFRLFNGRDFDGWRVAEDPAAFHVKDGIIVANGRRSHLFYDGPLMGRDFRNFEMQADVMTRRGANSAIYIHTHYIEGAWPNTLPSGYEIQINNTAASTGRTASVFTFKNLTESPARDDTWFRMHITVQGRRVEVRIDDRLVNVYTEPADSASRLTGGTFALQAHEPGEITYFRDILVRPLPD
jgi:hypothetical protein